MVRQNAAPDYAPRSHTRDDTSFQWNVQLLQQRFLEKFSWALALCRGIPFVRSSPDGCSRLELSGNCGVSGRVAGVAGTIAAMVGEPPADSPKAWVDGPTFDPN
jgi:hypothetical protein